MSNYSETQHALFMFTRTFQKYKNLSFLNLQTFSTGLPFAYMLSSISYFNPLIKQFEQQYQKVTYKLNNLKKLISKMQNYVQNLTQKSLKIADIDLIEIAKNNSKEEILKFFEVVIAVLMQTPEKQDHIQKIMDLDERSQQALVIVVQNAMEFRICELTEQGDRKLIERIQILQNENHILLEQINQLCHQNQLLQKQNTEYKQKIVLSEQQIQKAKNLNIRMYMRDDNNEKTENNMIENLKTKMLSMIREHEGQMSKCHEEIELLKGKIMELKDMEEEWTEKQTLFEEKLKQEVRKVEVERKKTEEKQMKIKKLQYQIDISKNKIRELSENIELNDFNLRMELEKKQVRFKQLQKEVKTRIVQISDSGSKRMISERKIDLQREMNEEEFEFLKIEVEKLRNSVRDFEKQNLKLKKKVERVETVENQKKKLEKVILDVSKNKDCEIEMLVVALYDLRNQNVRMHQVINEFKNRQPSVVKVH